MSTEYVAGEPLIGFEVVEGTVCVGDVVTIEGRLWEPWWFRLLRWMKLARRRPAKFVVTHTEGSIVWGHPE